MAKIAEFEMSDGRIAQFEVDDETTPEQAQVIFEEFKKKQQDPSLLQKTHDVLNTANSQIAGIAGAPVDFTAGLMSKVGLYPEHADAFGGSKSIKRGFDNLGIGYQKEGDPESRLGRILGDTAGFALPLAKGAQAVSKTSGALGAVARDAIEAVAKNPKMAGLLELLGISGAAAGGNIAESSLEEGPHKDMFVNAAELGGGVGATLAPAALKAVSPLGYAYRTAKKAFIPFTEAGGRDRAADRIKSLIVDPSDALRALDDPSIADLTPAQRIGETGLHSLERKVADTTPKDGQFFEATDSANMETLRQAAQEIGGQGDINNSREYLSNRIGEIQGKLKNAALSALDAAEQRVAGLSPEMRISQSSSIYREELETAFTASKRAETAKWEAIPGASVSPKNTLTAIKKITAETPRAQVEDIPMALRTWKSRGFENIKEMQGLRSKLLEEARGARATGKYNTARLAEEAADAVLLDMGVTATGATGKVGQKLREALDYSRQLNQTFRQGKVGKILGNDRLGGDKIAPENTLERLIGSGKEEGFVGLRQGQDAVDTDVSRKSVEQFLRDKLQGRAVKNGQLNPASAERFMREHRDVLDSYPALKKEIEDAVLSTRSSASVKGREIEFSSNVVKSSKSAAGQFLNAPVGKEINSLYLSHDPAGNAKDLMKLVRRSPEATQGIRAAVIEDIFQKSGTGKMTAGGKEIISGDTLLKHLNDKRMSGAMVEILGADGVDGLRKIAFELMKINRAQGSKAADHIINDAPNTIIAIVARVGGARIGGAIGKGTSGGSLQSAATVANNAKKLLGRLTNDTAELILMDALKDKELMKTLLLDVRKPANAIKVKNRLKAWAVASGHNQLFEEEGEE